MSEGDESSSEGSTTVVAATSTTARRRPPPRLTEQRRQALELRSIGAASAVAAANNENNSTTSSSVTTNPYIRNNNDINNNNIVTTATTTATTTTTAATTTNNNNDTTTATTTNNNRRTNTDRGWSPHATIWFKKIKKEIENQVVYKYGNGRGETGKYHGSFPKKYMGIVSPSIDPISHFGTNRPLTMDDFLLPDVFVWYPEAQYKDWYEDARPKCKWHGCTDCVKYDGWMNTIRHGYREPRITAIIARKYTCQTRKTLSMEPYSFRGIDRAVIEQSEEYVKQVWAKIGFDVSHRAAIAITDLERLRSNLNQGLGVSGFRRSMIESMRTYHIRTSIQWSSYVNHLDKTYKQIIANGDELPLFLNQAVVESRKEYFAKFLSNKYHQPKPSNTPTNYMLP